ncbi:MAG: polysaccharide biosynthesis protein [Saprospiraceae bacterium]
MLTDVFLSFISYCFASVLILTIHALNDKYTFWQVFTTAIVVAAMRFFFFWRFRTYSFIIRFLGERDVIKAVAAIGSATVFFFLLTFAGIPLSLNWIMFRSLLVVDFVLLAFMLLSYRIAMRLLYNYLRRSYAGSMTNIIIFGAGELGAKTIKVLQHGNTNKYNVVGIIDDNTQVNRKFLDGIKVFLPEYFDELVEKHQVKKAIIAVKNLNPVRKKAFIEICLEKGIGVMEVAPTEHWLEGNLNSSVQLKNIKIEDLLNRPTIELDSKKLDSVLQNKTILVTGAAGSIGSEIVRQLIHYRPAQIILIDQAESPLVELELEMKESLNFHFCKAIVADVRNYDRIKQIFESYRPSIVFHAAAYKHVPIMESYPSEAILINVNGSKILANLSLEYNVEKFVLVSTDKAVNPTNVMGASKRIAEIYTQSLFNRAHSTQFVTTRFGNVLGSNGSVIPRFSRQIETGGPITVTHPDITRYFMTIPEACQLVLEAGAMGNGGEIFVFDMGEPVKIVDLAEKMIKLTGLTPYSDIDIKFTGLRPGEKIFEELLNDKETTLPTHHEKILRAKVREYDFEEISVKVSALNEAAMKGEDMEVVRQMKLIVPEFVSDNSIYQILDDKLL